MSKATLDLLITIKGDETVLKGIQRKFNDDDDECTRICHALASMTHQFLIATGVTEELKLGTHCGQVKSQLAVSGGLNAMEWLDIGGRASE